ncbi:MAG: hypothetical protein ACLQLH_02370 [Terracidiphilus sp.]
MFVHPIEPRQRNLLWSALRKLRPANPLNLFPHLAEKYGDAVHDQVGSNHFMLLSYPDYVRESLVVQQDNFVKERTMQRSRMLLGKGISFHKWGNFGGTGSESRTVALTGTGGLGIQ